MKQELYKLIKPIKDDGRYTTRFEYCGQPTARIVVRFCGDWVGHVGSDAEAIEMITAHMSNQ